ncbi:MAG: YfhO family protein [Hyphomonadaceae bacterium]|nr:YfhO family protein [Hyphomonadaceae bacterium]
MLDRIQSHWRLCAIAFVLSVGLLVFHGLTGTPEGNSYKYNLPWYEAFRNGFWAGDLYPRYTPELWYGLGGVDFYFYGPLPFWFTAMVGEASCAGCGTGTVFSIGGAWLIILSGITFFAFARRFFDVPWAGFGAILYAVLPYHYVADWFDRQAIGEIAAVAILPLVALAVTRLIADRKGGFLFALSIAALSLSHLPSTLIVGHLLAALLIWALYRQTSWSERLETGARFGIWGALGIGLSAIYWVPALGLLSTVSPDMLTTDYYDATRWLLFDGMPEISPETSAFVKACLALVVVIAAGSTWLLRATPAQPGLQLWIIGPSVFTFYLLSVLSYPIWDLWILNRIQFPWRTLIVSDLSVALGATVIAKSLVEARTGPLAIPVRLIAIAATGVLLVAYAIQIPRVVETIENGLGKHGTYKVVGTPEYVPPAFLQPALTRFRSVVTDEHDSEERFDLFFAEMRTSVAAAERALQTDAPGAILTRHRHDRVQLEVNLEHDATVRLPLAAWPHWRAETGDGRALSIGTDAALGLVTVSLPQGNSIVELSIVETQPQHIGSTISRISLILLLLGAAFGRYLLNLGAEKPLATSPR